MPEPNWPMCCARYIGLNQVDWPSLYPVIGETFADKRSTAPAIIVGFFDPRMKVEIKVTACKKGTY